MKKALFWVGSTAALLSLVGVYVCLLIAEVFPKAVHNLWSIFGGRYSPLDSVLDFTGVYILCAVVFAAGVGTAFWAYISEKKGVEYEKMD